MKCKKCGEDKPEESFYKDKYTKSGRKSSCKECFLKSKKSTTKKRKREEVVEEKTEMPPNEDSKSEVPQEEEIEEPSSKKVRYTSDDENSVWQGAVETDYPDVDWDQVFNIREDGDAVSVLITASRKSGKTTWSHSMWERWKGTYDGIIMFCNSLQAAPYKKFLDEEDRKLCFDEFHPEILNEIEHLQKKTDNAFHFLIFFDDCSSKKFKSNDALVQQYIRGRNMNCSIVFSTQSPMFVDKDARGNVDYLILMRPRTPDMKDALVEHFLWRVVPTPKGVKKKGQMEAYLHKWLDVNTQDHYMVIIDYMNNNQIYKHKVDIKQLEGVT